MNVGVVQACHPHYTGTQNHKLQNSAVMLRWPCCSLKVSGKSVCLKCSQAFPHFHIPSSPHTPPLTECPEQALLLQFHGTKADQWFILHCCYVSKIDSCTTTHLQLNNVHGTTLTLLSPACNCVIWITWG